MRKRKAWSVEELAAKCGLESRIVIGIEQGKVDVQLDTIAVLANALKVDATALLSRATKQPRSSAMPRTTRPGR